LDLLRFFPLDVTSVFFFFDLLRDFEPDVLDEEPLGLELCLGLGDPWKKSSRSDLSRVKPWMLGFLLRVRCLRPDDLDLEAFARRPGTAVVQKRLS
jgi:hypothetical protein